MKVFIVSLKYSPGHYSHLVAFYKLFEALECEPYLYLDEKYTTFLNEDTTIRYIYANSRFEAIQPELVLFYNIALNNHIVAKKFKNSFNPKIMYVYHEPWDGFVNYFKEGFIQGIKMLVANKCSKRLLRYCDKVLLPSFYALKNYKKYESIANNNYEYFPLIFSDEKTNALPLSGKMYFSFIGNAIKIHQFPKFIEFMKFGLKNNVDYKFLIATRANIDRFIDKDIEEGIRSGKVKIFSGAILSNKEINDCYKKSFCVWNLYSRITQSGVLGKAFMVGTPVLASNIGSFPEYVIDRYNGMIKPSNIDFNEINDAALTIKNNLDMYSMNARKTFEAVFFYKVNEDKLWNILNDNSGCDVNE